MLRFLTIAIVVLLPITGSAASFVLLESLSPTIIDSPAIALSADGSTATGRGTIFQTFAGEPVFWDTRSGKVTPLRENPIDDGFSWTPIAISADSQTIVGRRQAPEELRRMPTERDVFRWTKDDGITFIEELRGANILRTTLQGASRDADVIVGYIEPVGEALQAFRWSASEGLQLLQQEAAEGVRVSIARAVSDDGTVVVGDASWEGVSLGFRWQEETGVVAVGSLIERGGTSIRTVSADGQVLGGVSNLENSSVAVRWTPNDGIQSLGRLLDEDNYSEVSVMSPDGRFLLGVSRGASGRDNRPFVWYEQAGMLDLASVLEEDYQLAGVFDDWGNVNPTGISDDGLTILGSGRDPRGIRQGWVVHLDHPIGVPEPAGIVLLAAVLLTVLPLSRHR